MLNDHEQQLLQQIKDAYDDVDVPPSLSPDALEQRLEQEVHAAPRKRFRPAQVGALAACLLLVVGVGVAAFGALNSRANLAGAPAQVDTAVAMRSHAGEALPVAQTYDEIFDAFMQDESADGTVDRGSLEMYGDAESATADGAMDGAASDTALIGDDAFGSHSVTNTRTEGVDEGDLVKTDGRYLYTLYEADPESYDYASHWRLGIVDTQGETLEQLATIEFDQNLSVYEFYLQDNRLFVLAGYYEPYVVDPVTSLPTMIEPRDADDYVLDEGYQVDPCSYKHIGTRVLSYDVSDPAHPQEIAAFAQDGAFVTSRIEDSYLYLLTEYAPPVQAPSSIETTDGEAADTVLYGSQAIGIVYGLVAAELDAEQALVPRVCDVPLAPDNIYMPSDERATSYMVMSSIKLDAPAYAQDSVAVLTDYAQLYMGSQSIYLYQQTYDDSQGETQLFYPDKTLLYAFDYVEGEITSRAQTSCAGIVPDSFCIDEYDGTLRVVSQRYAFDEETFEDASTTELSVFDQDLQRIGFIDNIAPGEQLKSARFIGEAGYFVTFLQVDPLFVVDLSDPANPRITDELTLPGFSQYLHPYTQDKLLGIGYAADENTGVLDGLKLSMFDVSDPLQVRELHTTLLPEAFGSEVLSNYRAALVMPTAGLIGFPAFDMDFSYYVYTYDEAAGFSELLHEVAQDAAWYGMRGVVIDQKLYVVNNAVISCFSLDTGERQGEFTL